MSVVGVRYQAYRTVLELDATNSIFCHRAKNDQKLAFLIAYSSLGEAAGGAKTDFLLL